MPASRGNELVTLLERDPQQTLSFFGRDRFCLNGYRFDLVELLLSRLGFTAANKVLQMFSYGDKNVEVDGIGLQKRVQEAMGKGGTYTLLDLFRFVKGEESLLSDMLGE